jgi:hypothetical protein
MPLDKLEVVRRQLGTALALFLNDHDPVSVHVLASGACEIVEHLVERAGKKPFSSHARETFSDLTDKEFIKKFRKPQREFWNAFKHALKSGRKTGRDDLAILAKFSDEHNDTALFVGWHDYGLVTGALPIEAQAFEVWFLARHLDKRDPDIEEAFPNINLLERSEQKRRLQVLIEANRSEAMDPETEQRPLILSHVL